MKAKVKAPRGQTVEEQLTQDRTSAVQAEEPAGSSSSKFLLLYFGIPAVLMIVLTLLFK